MSVDVEGKTLVELLDMLEPAPPPVPIPMTPQTVGWLLVLVLLLGALAAAFVLFRRHRNRNAYRHRALRQIEEANGDVGKIAEILRRTALAAYPRARVAGLYGPDWVNFLNSTSKASFSAAVGQSLTEAPYKKSVSNTEVVQAAQVWVRTHQVQGIPN